MGVQAKLEKENVTQALYSSNSNFLHLALMIKGNWLGCLEKELDGNRGEDMHRRGSGLCQMYSQKQCSKMIIDWEGKRGCRYERVIYTRPDFHWTAPHIPLSLLWPDDLWIMD